MFVSLGSISYKCTFEGVWISGAPIDFVKLTQISSRVRIRLFNDASIMEDDVRQRSSARERIVK